MARKYAILENNLVIEVATLEASEVLTKSKEVQQLIDVEDEVIPVQVGWSLVGNRLCESSSGETLEQAQDRKFAEFDKQTQDYIIKHYPLTSQTSLMKMYVDAIDLNLPNRKAHIQLAYDWGYMVLGYHFGKEAEIYSTTTKEELEALTWDFLQFDALDPLIGIANSLAIPD